jgi:hypothetical protein
MKYFSEAFVMYMFLTLEIRGINDIWLISTRIHAPSHEIEGTGTNIPLTKVISYRILVELRHYRKECLLCLWGMDPAAYF